MNDYILVLVCAALASHLLLQSQAGRLHVLGLACALAIVLGTCGGQLLERWLVAPWQLQDLRLFLLLPWLAAVAWVVPRVLTRLRPQWPVRGLSGPIMGNAVVLGLPLQVMGGDSTWLATLAWSVCAGLGLWLALWLFHDLLRRSAQAEVPGALRGLPIALIGAGVMAMAFSGFNGLFTQ